MTSPVAAVGAIWDGFDLQRSDLDIFFEITEGLDGLPTIRTTDQIIPFRSGRLPQPGIADGRPIVGTGWIAGDGATPRVAFRAYLDSLKAKLDPTRDPRLLVAIMEDGTRRWIRAVPRDLMQGEAIGGEHRMFSVEWQACDPYWYGASALLTADSGLFADAGLSADQSAIVTINPTSSPFTFTVDVAGTADVERVRVEIDGPTVGNVTINNKSVIDGANYGFTYLGGVLVSSDRVVVDSGERIVTLNGDQGRADLQLFAPNLHGEYLRLRPGPNVIATSGQPREIRLIFDSAYL